MECKKGWGLKGAKDAVHGLPIIRALTSGEPFVDGACAVCFDEHQQPVGKLYHLDLLKKTLWKDGAFATELSERERREEWSK